MNRKFETLIILIFLLLLSFHNNHILDSYQLEVNKLEQEVKMLRVEQEQLERQIKSFVDKWDVSIFESTAYAPFDNQSGMCADSRPHITSIGARPGPGTVAVNPTLIKYRSKVWVQGYGWGKALDTGSAMRKRNDLIDVYMDSYLKAKKWGRRKVICVWQKQF